jgi:hypothetical protein
LALASHLIFTVRLVSQPEFGLGRLARSISSQERYRSTRVLVAGGPTVQGSFIASLAMADGAARHHCIRTDKLLARSSWMGDRYRSRVSSSGEAFEIVQRLGVGLVVLDTSPRAYPHDRHLAAAFSPIPPGWTRQDSQGAANTAVYAREILPEKLPDLQSELMWRRDKSAR